MVSFPFFLLWAAVAVGYRLGGGGGCDPLAMTVGAGLLGMQPLFGAGIAVLAMTVLGSGGTPEFRRSVSAGSSHQDEPTSRRSRAGANEASR
ncbi:hypothetical protein ACWDPV_01730 [Gordonia sp. NPDC003504]